MPIKTGKSVQTAAHIEKTPNEERYFSKAIGNALDILGIFRRRAEPMSLSQVTAEAGLSKSSVFRILRTLESAGYLEQAGGGRYALSPLIASLTPNNLAQKLAQASTPHVQELSREFRETVSVAFAFENHIEVVVCLPSPQKIQMGNIVGSIIPPHASSLGKSILANLPEQRRERLLRTYGINRLTEKTIVDEVELSRELATVHDRGYATDLEESTLEGCCFGAPILDASGYAIGAVSVSSPKMRCVNEEKLLPALRSAAEAISRAIQSQSDSFRQ